MEKIKTAEYHIILYNVVVPLVGTLFLGGRIQVNEKLLLQLTRTKTYLTTYLLYFIFLSH